jgi:prevent-host-death family protein
VDVGIGELRNGFSRYLAKVRAGRTITITDRGRPIARIVPVGVPTVLERLVAEGRVVPPRRRRGTPPESL